MNYTRILLITFVLFCLVIRTAYQGVFYTMMVSEMRKKSPETIDDLKNQNYSIVCFDDGRGHRELLNEMIEENRR